MSPNRPPWEKGEKGRKESLQQAIGFEGRTVLALAAGSSRQQGDVPIAPQVKLLKVQYNLKLRHRRLLYLAPVSAREEPAQRTAPSTPTSPRQRKGAALRESQEAPGRRLVRGLLYRSRGNTETRGRARLRYAEVAGRGATGPQAFGGQRPRGLSCVKGREAPGSASAVGCR